MRVRNGECEFKLLLWNDRVGKDLEYALKVTRTSQSARVVSDPTRVSRHTTVGRISWLRLGWSTQRHWTIQPPGNVPATQTVQTRVRTDLESFFTAIKERVYLIELNSFDELVFRASTGLWS